MINKSNLTDLLLYLKFKYNTSNNTYSKQFHTFNDEIVVDFNNDVIKYPKRMKINTNTTTNFSSNENFVVLECVNRLFEKGYRPEHIELEKKWSLGHDEKSGRADICVTNPTDDSMLIIIECKTWGKEFDKAKKNTITDGGQLFSYWQQEQSTKWLVLYASDFINGQITYKAPTIDCSDDNNIVELSKKDSTIKLYSNSHTAIEKHTAWIETYSAILHNNLVFSDYSVAYQIGVKPLLKKDLKDFTPEDKIVNRFEEILRHNNVSDKENAFNRLVALFICKLVDEITKNESDEVEFQYKQGVDTYESLQDRLQRLHKDGMEKFMREKIYYISDDYAENLVKQYTGQKRKNMIQSLKDTIRILKYYTNNDFAFKDVHNEELFYQNGKVLVEMVQLFEKYRIVYNSKHQFLGDLFEQLLNKGFKQDEGQFFTPMPITRFIWDSLPVKQLISNGKSESYPKVIDYACGAGHFLTEAIEAISHFAAPKNNDWVRDHIFGIEKDYRLARVAKISMFMNGAGESNISFADGLENNPDKNIENNTFDILVANPPYSVKDFKQHLVLKNNNFELLDRISNNSSEIEVLFIERIAQLLKPKGIAAVILPSSILSNDSLSYVGAREILLKNFYIRAIVSLGAKTFGETGTNTVILFLEKFDEPPKTQDITFDTIDSIFNGNCDEGWSDKDVFESYLNQIGIKSEVYIKFIEEGLSYSELNKTKYFSVYIDSFENSIEYKNLIKTKKFNQLSEKARNKEILSIFYKYTKKIEKEKMYYFALIFSQKTVIVKAPTNNKEQEQFLGYKWSNRKGNEGIKIIKKGGRLFDNSNRDADGTVASYIRKAFSEFVPVIEKNNRDICSVVNTKDMIDFSRSDINKSILLYNKKSLQISSKYPLKPLGKICDVLIGGTPARANYEFFTGSNLWVSISEMNGNVIFDTKEKITDEAISQSNVKLIPKGTTLLSFKLSIGKTAIAGKDLYTNEAIAGLIPKDKKEILDEYIFYLFKSRVIDLESVGNKAFGKSLNSTYLKNEVLIPIPDIETQKEIIKECKKIDFQYNNTRMSIKDYQIKMEDLFNKLNVINTR